MTTSTDSSADDAPIGRRGSYSKGIARRQEILDRALEVFRERGPEDVSLRKVAVEIGVSHGALLHYFRNREQLLLALYEHTETERHEQRDEEVMATEGAVEAMVQAANVNVARPGYVQLYTALVANALEEDGAETRDYFVRRFEQVRRATVERLRRQQEAGTLREGLDLDKVAALVVAASDGLQTQWLLDDDVDLTGSLELLGELLEP